MKAKCVEDLHVWQGANELWDAINAILDKPGLLRDRSLRDQISTAADSIVSNIREGFEQPTDRAFVRYLFVAKASNAEARTRLSMAAKRSYITKEELAERDAKGDEVARMLTGLIKYLLRSNRRDRGIGRN